MKSLFRQTYGNMWTMDAYPFLELHKHVFNTTFDSEKNLYDIADF